MNVQRKSQWSVVPTGDVIHKILDDTPVTCFLVFWMTAVLFEAAVKMQNLLCQVRLFKRGNIEKVKKWEKETNVHDNQSLFVALRANWLVCWGCENKHNLHESLCSLSVSQISVSGSVHEITAVQQYSCLQGYLWSCWWGVCVCVNVLISCKT